MPVISCFGETLWDVFPDQKKIGGAPLNVTARLKSFGLDAHLISRVGKDENAAGIITFLEDKHISISNIQVDPRFPTGTVEVKLDASGSASYDIAFPAAWDHTEMTPEALATVRSSLYFIFGSLASRNEVSRNTLIQLLEAAKYKVFDVNLRPPYDDMPLVLNFMKSADFIKLNDEELEMIAQWLGFAGQSLPDQLKHLSQSTDTPAICLTMGAKGAILFADDAYFRHPGYKIQVVDTVGAGDSFLAGLICKLSQGIPKAEALDFACALGALVASKKGGNAPVSKEEIEKLQNNLK